MPLASLQVAYAVKPPASFATIPLSSPTSLLLKFSHPRAPCVCPTIQTLVLSLRGQCKLILSCIKRRETRFAFPPPPLLTQSFCITSPPPSRNVYLYFPIYSPIWLPSHVRFLASNDIYAILIGYLLYMQLHIRESTLPHPLHFVYCVCDGGLKLRTTSRSPATNPGGRSCGSESWRARVIDDRLMYV